MRGRRRAHKLSGGKFPAAQGPQKRAGSAPARPPLSRRRKWLFRLAVTVLAPLLFLTLLEAGLRLGGYGYPTGFFVGPDAKGFYRTNLQFGWRFFPRCLARTPVPCLLPAKPAGTIRIFVLGGSAAQGVPDPSFSVGRVLEVLLAERYPDRKFEVINCGMTAINSHVVREIAGDCAAHQPDLFVVYMGNNEVVGPYGPGTIFEQWSPSLRLIRANVWLRSTRIGQLLDAAIGWLRPEKRAAKQWQGLEMFAEKPVAADDPRLWTTYGNFRQNLIDICQTARHAGAAVVLSTVAVNLKDCPPFASQHRSDLSPDELTRWKAHYAAGVKLEGKEKRKEALAEYAAAAKIDDRFAELAFRRGRCLAALGRDDQARRQFVLSRDLDGLRFRADSRIDVVIREVAAEQSAAGVRLADAERSLAGSELSVGGVPGEGLFYEHVHFTFEGNYVLARTLLAEVEAALPQLAAARKQEPIASKERCAELLTLTPWDEHQMARLMAETLTRPPFTGQLDHAARTARARQQAAELGRIAANPAVIEAAYQACQATLDKTPDDWFWRWRLGKLALASGRPKTALEHLQIAAKQLPRQPEVNLPLGFAAKSCGRIEEAISAFRAVLEIDPGLVMANYNLALVLQQTGQTDDAIVHYQKAIDADPMFVPCYCCLAAALESRGRTDQSIACYRKALELDPGFALGHGAFGAVLDRHEQFEEAVSHFQKALSIDPDCALAHNNFGVALAHRRRFDEAIIHFRKALEIMPDYAEARKNLADTIKLRERASATPPLPVSPNAALP